MQTDCAVRTNAVDLRSGPDGLRRCRLCECRGSHCRTWWKGHQPWHVFGGPAMFVWSLVWDELYAMPAETNNTNPIIPYLMMQLVFFRAQTRNSRAQAALASEPARGLAWRPTRREGYGTLAHDWV